MNTRRLPFVAFLAVSLAGHLAGAGVLRAGVDAAVRAEDEIVIDLAGSFRTRPAGRAAKPSPAATTAALEGAPVTEALHGRPESMSAGPDGDAEPGDPAVPLVGITALPELKARGALREKLERRYPAAARSAGVEGVVTLEVVVSSNGRVVHAMVVRADPAAWAPEFGGAALLVARDLEFTPARLGARPVAVRIRLPIRFEIER